MPSWIPSHRYHRFRNLYSYIILQDNQSYTACTRSNFDVMCESWKVRFDQNCRMIILRVKLRSRRRTVSCTEGFHSDITHLRRRFTEENLLRPRIQHISLFAALCGKNDYGKKTKHKVLGLWATTWAPKHPKSFNLYLFASKPVRTSSFTQYISPILYKGNNTKL